MHIPLAMVVLFATVPVASFAVAEILRCNFERSCLNGDICKDDKYSLLLQRDSETSSEEFASGEYRVVRWVKDAVSVVEFLADGSVLSTTVYADGSAVHSDHTQLEKNGIVNPSQSYGNCRRLAVQ